jgi:hypothetical protein
MYTVGDTVRGIMADCAVREIRPVMALRVD